MTLACCQCGAAPVMIVVGCDAVYAPGQVLITRGVPDQGWCERCALAQGRLLTPEAAAALACRTRSSPRKSAAQGKRKPKGGSHG